MYICRLWSIISLCSKSSKHVTIMFYLGLPRMFCIEMKFVVHGSVAGELKSSLLQCRIWENIIFMYFNCFTIFKIQWNFDTLLSCSITWLLLQNMLYILYLNLVDRWIQSHSVLLWSIKEKGTTWLFNRRISPNYTTANLLPKSYKLTQFFVYIKIKQTH